MKTQLSSSRQQPAQMAAPTVAVPDSSVAPLTYTVAETAHVLGVSCQSIYRLLDRRILHAIPCLRHKRIARGEVHALAKGGRHD